MSARVSTSGPSPSLQLFIKRVIVPALRDRLLAEQPKDAPSPNGKERAA